MEQDHRSAASLRYDRESEQEENEVFIQQPAEPWRNAIAFWLLGLCNNFGYVVMLSAAYDILKEQQHKQSDDPSGHETFHCNPTSTGVVLIADVLPGLLIKLTAPFYMQRINYHVRVGLCVFLFAASLFTVAYSSSVAVSLFGVVLASISSCVGEITFLAFSSYYTKTVISFWSSGTGMAGLAGSLAYAGLTQAGLSSRDTLLLLLVVAVVWIIAFWVILKLPNQYRLCSRANYNSDENDPLMNEDAASDRVSYLPMSSKLKMMIPLLKFMIPLFLVYLAEYTINQGLYELLYYDTWLSQPEQYRWYQVDYQLAVFISRSSIKLLPIKKIIIPVIVQWCILITLTVEATNPFLRYIWFALAIVFLEGLCGGAVYVNAFTLISDSSTSENREFRMGAASMADSIGITLAGIIAIPIHNAICDYRT
ncbi:battenin-like [Clytia hemisphaerica]|uniref:battenin-like n=1 Tax=Clytia hemisphaerica TaxID=252671 RepID=UPI0034D63218